MCATSIHRLNSPVMTVFLDISQELVVAGLSTEGRVVSSGKTAIVKPFLVRTQRDEPSSEVDLSATQVLLVTASGLGLTGPLIWLFVRYWLFAP